MTTGEDVRFIKAHFEVFDTVRLCGLLVDSTGRDRLHRGMSRVVFESLVNSI